MFLCFESFVLRVFSPFVEAAWSTIVYFGICFETLVSWEKTKQKLFQIFQMLIHIYFKLDIQLLMETVFLLLLSIFI